jgi:hypothetical protein
MAGDVHRALEALRRAVEQATLEVGLGREGDRMHQDVEPAPLIGDGVEHGLELAGLLDVERQKDGRIERLRQRLDMRPRLLVEVGDRELGTEAAKGVGAAVGD